MSKKFGAGLFATKKVPTTLTVSENTKKEEESLGKMTEDEILTIVKQKILDASAGDGNVDEKKLTDVAKKLAFVDEITNSYFNKDGKAVIEYFRTLPKNEKKGGLLNSQIESITQSVEVIDDDEDIFKIDEQDHMNETLRVNEKVKIKIVITEVSHNKKEKTIRKLLSPFASALNVSPQFGMFHSALIIGPWYLEWTNKALCIPKKIYSGAALLAVDVEHELELADVDFIIKTISKVITRWNVLHDYDKGKNNCQNFVDDVLESLGVDSVMKFKGPLGKVLGNLRNKGEDKISYELSDDIREALQMKEKSIFFKTHLELDLFVHDLLSKFPLFELEHKEDWRLLKSLDRAFWLRHLKDPHNKDFQPEGYDPKKASNNDPYDLNCPFQDPRETRSMGFRGKKE